jgi:hypothetical protein
LIYFFRQCFRSSISTNIGVGIDPVEKFLHFAGFDGDVGDFHCLYMMIKVEE